MGAAARQECPEGQGRALDEEERYELLRLQEPPRRGQGAQADPQMGCNRRGRARQSEARRSARSLQHRQRGVGGQRLPLGADRGEPDGGRLAEPYPPARCTQSSAVRAPEVGEHDALEGARPCRARIRPAAELDGRQDRAHHRHRASEIQDRHDEPRLQHPPAGSARADGSCTRLSVLTGGVRVHRAKHRADASQASKRSPIGDSPWHERCNARSAKTEIAESEYCSRFPLYSSCFGTDRPRLKTRMPLWLAIVQCAVSVAASSSTGASSGTAAAVVVVSSHSIGSSLRVIARASTSSMRETGTMSRPFLMLSLISTRSLAFSSGMSTVLMPPRKAASSFSLRPAIGSTRPRSVISPVMATSRRTGMPVITDTIAVAMATPADGPSFGVAPSGTCTWMSRLSNKGGLMPKATARMRT